MLNRLRLENFKAWRKADLAFGKVTGFFGTNSAGKSSLLQFLLLLKQTRNATDRGLVLDFGGGKRTDLVNLGTFTDVVHRHDEDAGIEDTRIRWRLDWTLPEPLEIRNQTDRRKRPLFTGDALGTECEVGLWQERIWPYRLAYRLEDARFELKPRRGSVERFDLKTNAEEFGFKRTQGRPWPLPHPVKTHLFPNEARSYYQNSDFLGDFELAYEKLMDSLYYLGPLREYPRREYPWAGVSPGPDDVGQRGEGAVDAILAATRDQEKRTLKPPGRGVRKIPFQRVIAHWLKELGLIHDFRLEEIADGTNLYRAKVKTSSSGATTALTDVGFGVSQVLPALVLLYYVPEGSTVLMEQPEIHLHPAVQSGLADVMLNVAAVRNVQIIVESHSEHLMRRLQRRVAEQEASSEDVKLYFVSPQRGRAQRGQAHVSDLVLNEWGEIENWPENFFGDEMGEVAAIMEAALRRKMEQAG